MKGSSLVVMLIAAMQSGCYLMFPHEHHAKADPYAKLKEVVAAEAPAPVSFPEAQALAGRVSKEWAAGYGSPPPTVMRVFVGAPDWAMDRNENTGRVTGRAVMLYVFFRGGQTGQCHQYLADLYEEEQRGRWGRPRLTDRPNTYIANITCDSIERLPPGVPL